jgi:8-oxo-dGTP pyrophosphatase MutT (NUDIX family)
MPPMPLPDLAPILRLHAVGDWPPGRLITARTPSTWHAPPDVEEHVDRAWAESTSRPDVNLFDGPMCRLESWDAAPDRLLLILSNTTYKRFLGTNLTRPDFADVHGRAVLANPVGVSPALVTADEYLMMGRRNAAVAYYPERIHPFAGALDPGDADPFAAVRRELREELGLADADVPDVRCTGIAEDLSIRQPELIFLARTSRTRAQIESALDAAEHRGTWSAPATPDGVAATLRTRDESFTPVAVASLLLYARLAFGDAWFTQHASAAGAAGEEG